MSHLSPAGQIAGGKEQHDEADVRLQGRLLLLVRIVWVLIALVSLSILLTGLPVYLHFLQMTCGSVEACNANGTLASEDMHTLHRLGISLNAYVACMVLLNVLSALGWMTIGWLIFWRRSNTVVTLCAALFLVTFPLGFGIADALAFVSPAWFVPVKMVRLIGDTLIGLFISLFPNGRFVPRFMHWFVFSYLMLNTLSDLTPAGSPFNSSMLSGTLFLFMIAVMGFAQVYRYRKVSNPIQRQQTKWVVFGITMTVVGYLALFVPSVIFPALSQPGSVWNLYLNPGVILAALPIPLSIGIAILRFRLWDIDLVINRTLVYGLLTAFVVGFYILVVGYLGAIFRTEGNLLISLIATGLVAVLFQPLRNVLQRAVNRLVYGLRDEPYVALSRLGQRLRTTLEPDAVLLAIVATVRETLKLSYAAIEVPEGASFVLAAASGASPTKEATRLSLVHQGKAVGTLLIAPRRRDDTLTPADLRLLDDLTHQIGNAVHTVRLTSDLRALTRDLQHSREKLVATREEERRRLRRDLHDGLGPTLSAVLLKVGLVCTLYRHDPETTGMLLKQLENEVESVIGDIRRVVYNLRPPALDELGLIGALREYVARLGNNEAMPLNVAVEALDMLPPLPASVEVAAYRIAQEAVTNVLRHASAQSCIVRIWVEDGLRIEVSDDGIGMDETERIGVGLTSMCERAEELGGTFAIRKNEPRGTLVTACLPLVATVQAEARM